MCTAHVEGDIKYKSLTIETGAEFDGRSKLNDVPGLSWRFVPTGVPSQHICRFAGVVL